MNRVSKFFDLCIKTLLSIIKIFFLSNLFYKTNFRRDTEKELIILGNGPSLKESIVKYEKQVFEKNLLCVNFFGISDFFRILKPKLYVLVAPEFFNLKISTKQLNEHISLFETIANIVDWKMEIFVPSYARKIMFWKDIFNKNPFIEIRYINTTPIEGFNFFNYLCFKYGLGLPRPHNVLIPSIVIGVNLGFSKIYLLGADHSWFKELNVTSDNNVLLKQIHFYDEKSAEPLPMSKGGFGERKLHEILLKWYYTFRSYFILEKYSNKMKSKIINLTPNSFIDAFQKENNF